MSTGRTKAQTVQVRIFSTQTKSRKKVHISQLFLKFHMRNFFSCISEELLFEKSKRKRHVNKGNKTQEISPLSHRDSESIYQ